jgi:hypothetical protein
MYTFAEEKLASKVESPDGLGITRVRSHALPAITLKPVRAGEKATCQVTWRYGLTMPEQYSDVTDLSEATMGATIQVESLPDELEFVSGGDSSLHHQAGSQSWYFDKAFIAGQHVRAWWYRKKPAMRAARPTARYQTQGSPDR